MDYFNQNRLGERLTKMVLLSFISFQVIFKLKVFYNDKITGSENRAVRIWRRAT